MLTFAVVPLGVAGSFWALKLVLAAASLGTIALVWKCARLLGRDPLAAVALVGLNPIVLVWGLGGDHNDFLMVLCIVLGFYLLLRAAPAARTVRQRSAGGTAPAGLLPLVAVRGRRRRRLRARHRDQGLRRRADPGRAGEPAARAASAWSRCVLGMVAAGVVVGAVEPARVRPAHPGPEHPEPRW